MAQPLVEPDARPVDGEHAARLARLIRKQYGFVWRLVRRIGVTETEADSAVQQVFAAAAQRIGDIRKGSERAFLFSTALHVVARTQREREEQAALSDGALTLEELDEQQQAREILGVLLQQMPLELRVVFVLHEIEQFAGSEIAEIIGIPLGTVASRLSEAHDDFATHLEAGSEMADSLMLAAREEESTPGALQRTLRAFGLGSAAAEEALEETSAVNAPTIAPARMAAPAATHSPAVVIAAKWLAIGLVLGLAATSAVYALTDALAPSHNAAR